MSGCVIHDWQMWPETDGQEQRCAACGAYRRTPTPELPSVERGEMKMELPSVEANASPQESSMASGASRHVAPPEWFNMNSAPKDGTRFQVMHELDPYSEQNKVTAVWEDGRWACSEFFINPHTMFMFKQPTHWRPLSVSDEQPMAEDRDSGLSGDSHASAVRASGDALPLPSSPNKVEDLIGRLGQFHLYGDLSWAQGKELAQEAATLLQDQQSEISRLKEELQDARDKRNRWFTAHGIERTARVAAESQVARLKAALEWAMRQLGPSPRLIRGQNDTYCEQYEAARSALSNTAADKGDGHE